VKFAYVHMGSGGEVLTAVLGGHVDSAMSGVSAFSDHFKAGTMRVLATSDSEESKLWPGVKPLVQQGYKLVQLPDRALIAPAGVPAPSWSHWMGQ